MKLPLAAVAASVPALSAVGALPKIASYPPAPRSDFVEKLHGRDVPDHYRWMEDTKSEPVVKWVEAESKLSREFLSKLPGRDAIKSRIEELWNYDKPGLPEKIGGRLFYTRKSGLQNQAVQFWRDDTADAREHVLIDPNKLSADGTVALAGEVPSDDGKYLAYGLSRAGSDWEEWRVIDVASGRQLEDEIKWVKFSSASWSHRNDGFYYGRYAEPAPGAELKQENINQRVFFHTIGRPQSEDQLVYERPDHPKWMFGAGETDDGAFLIIHVRIGAASKSGCFYRRIAPGSPVVELLKDFDARYDFVGNEGETFFFLTDKDAPRWRLIAIDLKNPEPSRWRTLIPESAAVLQSASYLSGKFIVQMLTDAHDEVRVFDASGSPVKNLPLPDMASAGGFRGRQTDVETFYMTTGYARPQEIHRFNVASGESSLWWRPVVKFKPDDFVTTQAFYKSRDGTRVPMFVSHKRDLVKNGDNPTILYGYGGFNNPLGPVFSPWTIVWMELGGVYAVANLRGGGEYGEEWHKAGQRLNKQNVFDDFIAGAEFLISERYTSSARLGISGGSNGGLLVAACLLQRPELFGATAPAVGVHDLLRFHKWTIGWAWQDEYGFPDDDPADFANLLKLSPYHNVKAGVRYPPTLISTADHDDRVFPAHSFKFGAAMQAAQAGEAPGHHADRNPRRAWRRNPHLEDHRALVR